jgi:uncharacterized membrane protein
LIWAVIGGLIAIAERFVGFQAMVLIMLALILGVVLKLEIAHDKKAKQENEKAKEQTNSRP